MFIANKQFGSPSFTPMECGAVAYELAKQDGSIATFFMVHNGLGMNPIDQLGSEE